MAMTSSDLPGPRSTDRQRQLFETKVATHGMVRWWAGDFVEQLITVLSGGVRLRTDSRCVTCPDVQLTTEQFLESKSVGKSDEAIVYAARLQRDHVFCRRGRQLTYCFVHHHAQIGQAESQQALQAGLAAAIQDILLVPLHDLYRTLRPVPPMLINNAYATSGKRIGWGGLGYGYGWTVSLKPWRQRCQDLLVIPRLIVYDSEIRNVRVRFHPRVSADTIMQIRHHM